LNADGPLGTGPATKSDMIGILMATLLSLSALQPAPQPTVVPSSDASDALLDPFAARATRPDAAPAPSDLIDPFNHPPRRTAPVDCSEPVLRDPFASPAKPRTAAFPGLIDPFAQ
jgi:hypothetical protein